MPSFFFKGTTNTSTFSPFGNFPKKSWNMLQVVSQSTKGGDVELSQESYILHQNIFHRTFVETKRKSQICKYVRGVLVGYVSSVTSFVSASFLSLSVIISLIIIRDDRCEDDYENNAL